MTQRKHAPKNAFALMSVDKLAWRSAAWEKRPMKQPRVAVFQFAMNATPRPTRPDETVAYGYMNHNRFHDREPEAILRAIEELDPEFFDTYPRKRGTELTDRFKRMVSGEAAREFYRQGRVAYGIPGLRTDSDGDDLPPPLARV